MLDHAIDQRDRLAGVGASVSSGEHADRARLETRDVDALVDAARETGYDDVSSLSDAAREPLGEGEARSGRIARTDDRDRRLLQRLLAAAKRQDRGAESICRSTGG